MKRIVYGFVIIALIASIAIMGISCKETSPEVITETVIKTVTETVIETVEVAKESKGSIKLYSYWPSGVWAESLGQIISDFTAETGIEIDLIQELGGIEYLTALQLVAQTEDRPDIFQTWNDAGKMAPLLLADLVVPLEDLLTEIGFAEKAPTAMKTMTFEDFGDSVQGIAIFYNDNFAFYNPKVFQEAGIETPINVVTIDELVGYLEKLKDVVKYPIMIGAKDLWPTINLLFANMEWSLSEEQINDLFRGNLAWDSPEVRAALEVAEKLKPYISTDLRSYGYGEAGLAMANGECGIYWMGDYLMNLLEDEAGGVPGEDFDMFTVKALNPDVPPVVSIFSAGAMSVLKTGNEDVSFEFIKYMATEKVQGFLASSLRATAAIETGITYTHPIAQKIQDNWGKIERWSPGAIIHGGVFTEYASVQTDFYLGDISLDEFLKEMDEIMADSVDLWAQTEVTE